ncbi:signal recognition particle subunit SRP19/SEC65 family protein [Ferroplasma sp.]|uniref:signal recognition particle subunit SRP19/SEC65 family protein n=1 Tax=Ferroplasma sp. TaxID=2591003 RepID=UPI00307DD44F
MIILYSQYFKAENSRKYGRRINVEKAKNYSDEKLAGILKAINVKYEVRDAHYSRMPYEDSKMFVIDANIKKSTILKIIQDKL